ncbi:MAG: hypothetical protein ACLGGX_09350 [Bdellovibrionia bacterium]
MKKTLLVSVALLLSATVQAKTMTCEVRTYTAKAGTGLMPDKSTISIQAVINDENQCGKRMALGREFKVCAAEGDFVGSYEAWLMVSDSESMQAQQVDSGLLLGTLRKSNKLAPVDGVKKFEVSVHEKLFNAGIEVDAEIAGESSDEDYAVVEGLKRGLLKEGQPVAFDLESCKID